VERLRHDAREPKVPCGKLGVVGYSFEQVFRAEYMPLRAYLYKRLGNPLAEDLAAETFAIAYRRWEDFDSSRPVRPWLYGISANLLSHHWRTERRRLRALARSGPEPVRDENDATTARADAQKQRRALAAALAELRPDDREALLLHAWGYLGDAEIAEALTLPVGTVKSRLHRAREQMENRLAASGEVAVTNDLIPTPEQ
jgi:RNA polymerase sigma-70 factor, ECF subfamily